MLKEFDIVKVKGKKGCYILINLTKKDIIKNNLRTFKIGLNIFGGFKYGNDPRSFNSYETLLPFPSSANDIKVIGTDSEYSVTDLKELLY